mgnify:FL=1
MKASSIKLAVFDVDGVLTDGRLYLQDDGQEIKAFHARDGLGIKALMQFNIQVAIITARKAPLVDQRVKELDIPHYVCGREDKATALAELVDQLQLDHEQVAYMGDDLVDWPAMRLCGATCAPRDSDAWLRAQVDHVTEAKGGQGAAREWAEKILADQGLLDQWRAQFR